MKKTILMSVAACLALIGQTASAAEVEVTGQVNLVRTHDATSFAGVWAPPTFWFTLKGVPTADTCAKFANGEVLFVGRDLQMMAFVMSALGKGMNVTVYAGPTETVNGYCVARYVTVSKPN
ncbi:hypothetical protein [Roseateles chitinivorans]|uniref:hypothetical protein n=1 Tax=Roseateles chitinivorans TaxID=2917965 RepID=UPI003D67091C